MYSSYMLDTGTCCHETLDFIQNNTKQKLEEARPIQHILLEPKQGDDARWQLPVKPRMQILGRSPKLLQTRKFLYIRLFLDVLYHTIMLEVITTKS